MEFNNIYLFCHSFYSHTISSLDLLLEQNFASKSNDNSLSCVNKYKHLFVLLINRWCKSCLCKMNFYGYFKNFISNTQTHTHIYIYILRTYQEQLISTSWHFQQIHPRFSYFSFHIVTIELFKINIYTYKL